MSVLSLKGRKALYVDANNRVRPVKLSTPEQLQYGWLPYEASGEHLEVSGTYDDSAFVRIGGKTIEVGEGEKSPDNPYQLKSVEPFDLVSAGRNLFDPAKFPVTQTSGGLTVSRESENITINGVNNSGGTLALFSNYFNLPEAVCNFSFTLLEGTFSHSVRVYLYQTSYLNNIILEGGTSANKTISISSGQYRLAIYAFDNYSFNNCKIKIQVKPGTTATPYEPFIEPQTIHIPYHFRGQGDTWDTLEPIGDGMWRYTQRRGRVVLDGSEDGWVSYGGGSVELDKSYFVNRTFDKIIKPFTVIMSDKFQNYSGLRQNSNTGGKEVVSTGDTTSNALLRIFIKTNRLSEVSSGGLNQWFSENPVTIEFDLAEPIITEIPYEEIKTFYDYTQMYTTGSEVQPLLEGKFKIMED